MAGRPSACRGKSTASTAVRLRREKSTRVPRGSACPRPAETRRRAGATGVAPCNTFICLISGSYWLAEGSMLAGLGLFWVGAVLFCNGLWVLGKIGDNEIGVIDVFVGSLTLLIALYLAFGPAA